ncbi:MAG: hypothetical protein H6617_03400 [Bdellovibrionaceae bacterium]|nr:hypothetical protein [Bdellovibrionales bacterium]MCB9253705.1 hypothetical protein [Pseudobdellovibrionaceae bacterium]
MAISKFFCQNLLSDYVEKLLPAARQSEVKQCLEQYPECREMYQDLVSTLRLLEGLPVRDISNDVAVRIMEASEGARSRKSWSARAAQVAVFAGVPLAVLIGVSFLYPKSVPVVSRMLASANSGESGNFLRYYPLYHGAADILDAQGAVIEQAENFSGSVWEEGGLSAEEFERTFQLQGGNVPEK